MHRRDGIAFIVCLYLHFSVVSYEVVFLCFFLLTVLSNTNNF